MFRIWYILTCILFVWKYCCHFRMTYLMYYFRSSRLSIEEGWFEQVLEESFLPFRVRDLMFRVGAFSLCFCSGHLSAFDRAVSSRFSPGWSQGDGATAIRRPSACVPATTPSRDARTWPTWKDARSAATWPTWPQRRLGTVSW